MKNYSQLIEVEASRINEQGMEIWYACEGKEHIITANPEQAADLLKKNMLIEDYSGAGDLVTVEWPTGFYGEFKRGPWEEFVKEFTLTGWDIKSIAALEEAGKAAVKEAQVFDKVQDDINKITKL